MASGTDFGLRGPAQSSYTDQEEANIQVVQQFLRTVYSPNASAENVKDIVASDSKLVAPTTLPDIHDCLSYGAMHQQHIKWTPDLSIKSYDLVIAKDNWVVIEYTAQGTHSGDPHMGIAPRNPPLHATWQVAALAYVESGKLKELAFEFNKLHVWAQWKWIKEGKDASELTPSDLE